MAELEVKVTVMDSDRLKRLIKRLKQVKWKHARRYAKVKMKR